MPTVALAAQAIGLSEERIVKSLLFHDRGGNLTLAIISGGTRVDRQLLGLVVGLDAPRLADAQSLVGTERVGVPAGARQG